MRTRRSRMRFAAVAWASVFVAILGGGLVPAARGHGAGAADFESVVTAVTPTVPIEVEVVKGDQVRFENTGDQELQLCGYTDACEPYARIGPDGVFVNHDSEAYFANQDADSPAPVPDGAGDGPPDWKRVRTEPPFFAYHDHRIHWMSTSLPPGVDDSKPGRQKVYDWTIPVRYGDVDTTVAGTLYYVGGESFWGRWGEIMLTVGGTAAMVAIFLVDARRRRRARSAAGDAED